MELSLTMYIIIIPTVFIAGLIDAAAGGGGLISVPAYLAAGLPPHYALGNNKFSSCAGTLVSTIRFFKQGMIDLPVALLSALLALIGSWLGTRTVLLIDPGFLRYLLLILIPVIAFITFRNHHFGEQDNSRTVSLTNRLLLGSIAGLSIGFYDGFFGPGTGTFLIFVFALLLKYDLVQANGNTKVVNLASNTAAVITFLVAGKILFAIAIPAAIAGIAGNIVGSHLVVKKGNKVIRPLFLFVLLILFAKVLYDLWKMT